MAKNLLLNIHLYEIVFEEIRRLDSFNEKGFQIILCNVLHNKFDIKGIFNESKYRYKDNSRYYFSDKDKHLCRTIKRKQDAKRCDIRLLEPPSWIELKLNKLPNEKDLENLFGDGAHSFKPSEGRYAISVFQQKKKDTVEKNIIKLQKRLNYDIKTKVFQINNSESVVTIIYM